MLAATAFAHAQALEFLFVFPGAGAYSSIVQCLCAAILFRLLALVPCPFARFLFRVQDHPRTTLPVCLRPARSRILSDSFPLVVGRGWSLHKYDVIHLCCDVPQGTRHGPLFFCDLSSPGQNDSRTALPACLRPVRSRMPRESFLRRAQRRGPTQVPCNLFVMRRSPVCSPWFAFLLRVVFHV